MPTIKQRTAFKKIMENHGNVSRAMLEAGYDPNSAKNPKTLTDSKGYRELLEESGLTEKLIATSLVDDIKAKPKNRVAELRLGSELLGMKAVEGTGDKTLVLIVSSESAKRFNVQPTQITEDSSN